jgi:hypothetical protein
MQLKTLDPEITKKLLEGHRDVVSPLADEREAFYYSQVCPHCGTTGLKKTGDARMMFRNGDPMPRYLLECEACGCVHDPHSGIIVTLGNLAKALKPAFPILDGPED